ncbi:protein phosphatase 1 regulatory subunit 3E-like [Protopterus annectens]|uniref:protein phosphatase 1 regulatory subunit 3E-like n=1 Tax=Protopterus annectens TaxID=7888 RepID=UPI001CFB5617|nr:protein phosphatase 1 regulatory subunit 3E-like [Protopterus annectens]
MSQAVPSPSACRDIPRNLSYTAGLFERACYRSPRPSVEEELEEELSDSEEQLPDAVRIRGRNLRTHPPSPTARRRARSAPADSTQAALRVSLRSYSPNTRKKVRFADSLGLELTTVHLFSQSDMPNVPAHVQANLFHDSVSHFGPCLTNLPLKDEPHHFRYLEPLFCNPGTKPDFLERVRNQKVCLESIELETFAISGTVRVLNLAFEKAVSIRYSTDDWNSYSEARAVYLSGDRYTDRFGFRLPLPPPHCLHLGSTLQFAVRYRVGLAEFWDNNARLNYKVQHRQLKMSPLKDLESSWIHFI